jgi:hypothetical protein
MIGDRLGKDGDEHPVGLPRKCEKNQHFACD